MVKLKSSAHDKVIKSIKKINDIHAKFGNQEKIAKAHRGYNRDTKKLTFETLLFSPPMFNKIRTHC